MNTTKIPADLRGPLANAQRDPEDYEVRNVKLRIKAKIGFVAQKDLDLEDFEQTVWDLVQERLDSIGLLDKLTVTVA